MVIVYLTIYIVDHHFVVIYKNFHQALIAFASFYDHLFSVILIVIIKFVKNLMSNLNNHLISLHNDTFQS